MNISGNAIGRWPDGSRKCIPQAIFPETQPRIRFSFVYGGSLNLNKPTNNENNPLNHYEFRGL